MANTGQLYKQQKYIDIIQSNQQNFTWNSRLYIILDSLFSMIKSEAFSGVFNARGVMKLLITVQSSKWVLQTKSII